MMKRVIQLILKQKKKFKNNVSSKFVLSVHTYLKIFIASTFIPFLRLFFSNNFEYFENFHVIKVRSTIPY